jgi:hypothetical protein
MIIGLFVLITLYCSLQIMISRRSLLALFTAYDPSLHGPFVFQSAGENRISDLR